MNIEVYKKLIEKIENPTFKIEDVIVLTQYLGTSTQEEYFEEYFKIKFAILLQDRDGKNPYFYFIRERRLTNNINSADPSDSDFYLDSVEDGWRPNVSLPSIIDAKQKNDLPNEISSIVIPLTKKLSISGQSKKVSQNNLIEFEKNYNRFIEKKYEENISKKGNNKGLEK